MTAGAAKRTGMNVRFQAAEQVPLLACLGGRRR